MPKPIHVRFEVPRELADAAYELLVTVRTSGGRVRKGANEVTKAVDRGLAKLVLIAEDVDPPEIVAHLPLLCDERKIPYVYVPSKQKLGEASGIEVQASSVCIVDPGEAKDVLQAFIEKLNAIRKGGAKS